MEEIEKLEVDHFKRRLRDCRLWNRKIIKLNLEIEGLENDLYGIRAVNYGEKKFNGKKDEDGLPDYTYLKESGQGNAYASVGGNIETQTDEIIRLMQKRTWYVIQIDSCRILLNKMDKDMKNAIIRMYVNQENHENIARDINYSRRNLYYLIDNEISKYI